MHLVRQLLEDYFGDVFNRGGSTRALGFSCLGLLGVGSFTVVMF
jgi:hypothetical protein